MINKPSKNPISARTSMRTLKNKLTVCTMLKRIGYFRSEFRYKKLMTRTYDSNSSELDPEGSVVTMA